MSEQDEVTAYDLFVKKLPEVKQGIGEWIICCSKCKGEFEKRFNIGCHTECMIPDALKWKGWQATKTKGRVRILCPKCQRGAR